jgi:hypothetical protein
MLPYHQKCDVLILGRWVTATHEAVTQICSVQRSISERGQQNKVHENKRKYNKLRARFITYGQVFEGVQKFKYLGSLINSITV